ncbi:MAG: quinoprotein dehydrogenase-associated putative ABC transporter substrate-binding protein [Gemmatimonadaceae bacterium]
MRLSSFSIGLLVTGLVFSSTPAGLRAQADTSTNEVSLSALPVVDAWRTIHALRVCGDPDNMPFSDSLRQGFEDKIADVIAKALGDSVTYIWWPHRRGFIRSTLSARMCDVVMGLPTGYDPVLETKPYYRSTYYVVSREDRHIMISSLDDPALRALKIGVNLIGEDYTNTPPSEALGARGMAKNVHGYSTFYDPENSPNDIMNAVVNGKVDVALVWGPLAGYYAKLSPVPLRLTALPDSDSTGLQLAYGVALGVRHTDREFRDKLNEVLEQKRGEIQQILHEFNVPMLPIPSH